MLNQNFLNNEQVTLPVTNSVRPSLNSLVGVSHQRRGPDRFQYPTITFLKVSSFLQMKEPITMCQAVFRAMHHVTRGRSKPLVHEDPNLKD